MTNNLYSPFSAQVIATVELAQAMGLNVDVFEGYRSYKRQLELWNLGREKRSDGTWGVVDAKKVVTKAVPGFSAHNYGLAVDIVFKDDKGNWTWDQTLPWFKLGLAGKECGLEWAGNWARFPEFPHFQNLYGFRIQQLYALYQEHQGLQAIWDIIEGRQNG